MSWDNSYHIVFQSKNQLPVSCKVSVSCKYNSSLFYKKINLILLYHKLWRLSIGFCEPASKREIIVSQFILILLYRGGTYVLPCELSTILTSQRAGFEIIGGAALFLHLLKKTIFRTAYIYIYISPLIIPQIIAFVNRVVSCNAPFYQNIRVLLDKTHLYYTINRSFCQDSCNFKTNLQLKPPFCRQNTHLFYTILLLFIKNYPQFPTFLHNFHYFFYYYYYIIIYIIYIILLKSNT